MTGRRQGGISGGVRFTHSLTVCCGVSVFSAAGLTPPKAAMISVTVSICD